MGFGFKLWSETMTTPFSHYHKHLQKRRVFVCCGKEVEGKKTPACVILCEDYEKVEKMWQKPKKVIELFGAKVEESAMTSPVGSHGTPPSTGSVPSAHAQHLFLVILSNETNEFRADSEGTKMHWVKLLTLLTMFPHSPIPEEPSSNPISESFRVKLDAKRFRADSAWAVYIMPEEVGSRCHMIGIHILLLKGGVPHRSVGKLEIVNLADPDKPIVTWDRDKMRRTGKTGNLVFIEIGRRCQGGEGLVWMYCGFDEATSLRETLHRFLFEGNGKPVSISPQDISAGRIYDRPRPSFDASYPNSYHREQSVSTGYQYHQVPPGRLREDSGYPGSPISSSFSPAVDTPPPVRLDKHPSFNKQRSLPCRVPTRRSSCSPSGSLDRDHPYSYGHSVNSLNEDDLFDERASSRHSVSPPDAHQDEGYSENDESGSGQFTMDPPDWTASQRRNTEPPLPSGPRAQIPQRSNTAPSNYRDYEEMVHPNASIYQEGYVKMIPGGNGMIPKPVVPSHYDVPSALRQRSSAASSSPSSSSPRKYENTTPLPTIEEAQVPKKREIENYENFPRPPDVKNEAFVEYQPNYENVDVLNEMRRASRSSESYENASIEREDDSQPRRASIRRGRSVDKEDVQLPLKGAGVKLNGKTVKSPSPPKNGMHFPYAELQSSLNPHAPIIHPTGQKPVEERTLV